MPRKRTRKNQTTHRREQPPTSPVEPVVPPIKANIEPPKSADTIAQTKTEPQVSKPRTLTIWIQSWLPIVLNALILIVIMGHAFYFQKQWDAMKTAVTEARISREIDNRAWVTVKGASLQDMAVGQPLSFGITYTNSGKSPALRARVKLTIEIRDTVTNHVDTFQHEAKEETVIGPGTDANTFKFADAPLDKETIDLFTSGRKKLYLRGTVEYDDIFKKERHHTTFCLLYHHPILNLEDCGGDAD